MPATKSDQVLFASTFSEHRLVIDPSEYVWEGSRLRGETKSHTIEFHDGTFRTNDPGEIAFLREKMQTEPAIYEIPQETPDPSALLVELVSASADRAEQILNEELEGWERDPVIAAAHARLASFSQAPVVDEAPFGRKQDGTPKKAPGGRPPREA